MSEAICDELLVTKISRELVRCGIMLPISEAENYSIMIYHQINEEDQFTGVKSKLDRRHKDEAYYEILSSLVVAEAIVRLRMRTATDAYEVSAYLTLVQKYIDKVAIAAQLPKRLAPHVFKDILNEIPTDFTIEGFDDRWLMHIPDSNGDYCAIGIVLTDVPNNFKKKLPICSTCREWSDTKDCNGCLRCSEIECSQDVTLCVRYLHECFGIAIDPSVVGIVGPYKKSGNNINVLRAALFKMAEQLMNKSPEIFKLFRTAAKAEGNK